MKKYIIAALLLITMGIITGASTCNTPTITVNAAGSDFNISFKDGKGCLNFTKRFKTDDVTVILDSLLNGIGASEEVQLELLRDSVTGEFILTGNACANIVTQSEQNE